MKRSKRIETLDNRPVNLDGYINEWPEMGFVAMKSPYDPTPSVKVQDGKIVELDGIKNDEVLLHPLFTYQEGKGLQQQNLLKHKEKLERAGIQL